MHNHYTIRLVLSILWLSTSLCTETKGISPNGTPTIEHFAPSTNPNDLWVDISHGNDANPGNSAAAAFQTIQKAASLAVPGATIHILPGIYRETIWPAGSGSDTAPVTYLAENGRGTVIIRGSESAASLNWTQMTSNTIGLPASVDPTHIYYADLSSWGLTEAPRFVAQLDSNGNAVTRLPLAREPDWQVKTDWKYHEFWWTADGGSDVAGCYPPTDPDPRNCDAAWRSSTQLTDRTNDTDPAGIEPGNLTTLGDLTGATLVAMDDKSAHYIYRRTITAHDIAAGRITINPPANDEGTFLLGWGTKYYIEGKASLLDNPGEWYFDLKTGRLYLWPLLPGSPASQNIEISRRAIGFKFDNRSYLRLDGLALEFFDESAIQITNNGNQKSINDIVRNVEVRYANRGIKIDQSAEGPVENVTDGFTLENSEISYMDSRALHLTYGWSNGNQISSFTHAGIINTVIRNNELHHLGFNPDSDNAVGSLIIYPDKLRFENNYVHDVAHNGIQFSYSVIQSPKTSGFNPAEIKTGDILIRDNIFEGACQLTSDCGALKFWGEAPDKNVFRDVLITGNIFRNTYGWTYITEKRGRWSGGAGSAVLGLGGFGLYMDSVSGMHVYRNIAFNNAQADFNVYGGWRNGDMVYYNNIAGNSLYGFALAGLDPSDHTQANTLFANNIFVNNEGYGILLDDQNNLVPSMSGLSFDHNLYYNNGWGGGLWNPGDMTIYRGATSNSYYPTLGAIQTNTTWEANGETGDPLFWSFDVNHHDLFQNPWPDFHITSASGRAVDQGTNTLPASLQTLITHFGVQDVKRGNAYDIGRYEAGFDLSITPDLQVIGPGGTANYTMHIFPPDLPYSITFSTSPPPPNIKVTWDPGTIIPPDQAIMTVTNAHSVMPSGSKLTLAISGTGAGFTQTKNVSLLVGGVRLYLPLVRHRAK